jgi:hypothetical protein
MDHIGWRDEQSSALRYIEADAPFGDRGGR